MDQYFFVIVAVGVVMTLVILLKANKVKLSSLFARKKDKPAKAQKEKKEKKEKKEEVDFIPKETVAKPKVGRMSKVVSKKKEKKDASKPAQSSQPANVEKVTRSDFEKYDIAIPKTSNFYSESEREQFIEEENMKNRPKGKGFSLGPKPKMASTPAPSLPAFDLPKSSPKDLSLDLPKGGSTIKNKFEDFDLFDDFDDFDDELFNDEMFGAKPSKPKETQDADPLGKFDDFDFDLDFDDEFGSKNSAPAVEWELSESEIFDQRKTRDKFSEVFGSVESGTFAKEILISKTVMEPAYKTRQRREEERKRRLGFM